MKNIFAIDPGTEKSGFCLLDEMNIPSLGIGVWPNEQLLKEIPNMMGRFDILVLEKVESYGMPVGKSVFETCVWSGRFVQRAIDAGFSGEIVWMPRRAVKLELCGTSRAKDSNIRAALIDLYGGSKEIAVGRKANPGPLYGVKSHMWSALALAVVEARKQGQGETA